MARASSTAGTRSGIAAAQITRVLPELVTIVGWEGCDHTGRCTKATRCTASSPSPAREPLPGGGGLVALRSIVRATRPDGAVDDVLDWRLTSVLA